MKSLSRPLLPPLPATKGQRFLLFGCSFLHLLPLLRRPRYSSIPPLRRRWGSASSSPDVHSSRFFLFSGDLVCGRSGLLNISPKHVYPKLETHILAFGRLLHRKTLHNLSSAGKKLFVRSFFGFSVATGSIYQQTRVIHAMDDIYANMEVEEPSGFLKDDLHTFWSLAIKFQLPVVLLITVLLGWRHPIALAINVALLLFCTRPNPMSIYMFVEQLRQRDMRRDPSLRKAKFLYVKKVEVEDYRILCMARVEFRDLNMDVVGIMGGWWVFRTSRSRGS